MTSTTHGWVIEQKREGQAPRYFCFDFMVNNVKFGDALLHAMRFARESDARNMLWFLIAQGSLFDMHIVATQIEINFYSWESLKLAPDSIPVAMPTLKPIKAWFAYYRMAGRQMLNLVFENRAMPFNPEPFDVLSTAQDRLWCARPDRVKRLADAGYKVEIRNLDNPASLHQYVDGMTASSHDTVRVCNEFTDHLYRFDPQNRGN